MHNSRDGVSNMKLINKICLLAGATLSAATLSTAASAAVVLDFSGIATTSNNTTVGGFYNGGTSGNGNTGTNFGVDFSSRPC